MLNRRPVPLKTIVQGVPEDFTKDIIDIISRILSDPAVLGIVYFKYNHVHMCTVPPSMRRALTTQLPYLSPMIHLAVTELNVTDELIAYRIATNTCEILVAGGKDIGAVVVQARRNTGKKKLKKLSFRRQDV